jgi:hypothetical protein
MFTKTLVMESSLPILYVGLTLAFSGARSRAAAARDNWAAFLDYSCLISAITCSASCTMSRTI